MPHVAAGARRWEVEAIVFDKDGVLLDFHALWGQVTRARVDALLALGVAPSLAGELTALLGIDAEGRVRPDGILAVGSRQDATLAAATRLHQVGWAWHDARRLAHEAFERAAEQTAALRAGRPLPGVEATLRGLHARGLRLAIATTDDTAGAEAFLAASDLAEVFGAVVGVDQVAASKPAPDLFLRACDLLGVAPARALMVGDVEVDLRMGRGAGAAGTIGVLSGVGTLESLAPWADELVPGVAALGLAP